MYFGRGAKLQVYLFILFIYLLFYLLFYLFIIYFNQLWLWTILWRPITRKIRVAQKNVIEEKLLEIKRSIRRGMYVFQICTVFFFHNYRLFYIYLINFHFSYIFISYAKNLSKIGFPMLIAKNGFQILNLQK